MTSETKTVPVGDKRDSEPPCVILGVRVQSEFNFGLQMMCHRICKFADFSIFLHKVRVVASLLLQGRRHDT